MDSDMSTRQQQQQQKKKKMKNKRSQIYKNEKEL